VDLPVSDRISVPGRTQEFGWQKGRFRLLDWHHLWWAVQHPSASVLPAVRRSYNPEQMLGLGCSAFARHY